jgi:hypothetical protein
VTKDETEETLSPFAAMAAKQGGGKKPNNYDLDSVEIGEFTETEAETKVIRNQFDCYSISVICGVEKRRFPERDIRSEEEGE